MCYNRGKAIEERMRKWFKGEYFGAEEIDFQTKTTLYEVKSCNLFNKSKHTLQRITTQQHGRFWIKIANHKKMAELAEAVGKKAIYVFAVSVGKQVPFLTLSWSAINRLLDNKECLNKEYAYIKIIDIFGDD